MSYGIPAGWRELREGEIRLENHKWSWSPDSDIDMWNRVDTAAGVPYIKGRMSTIICPMEVTETKINQDAKWKLA